MRRLQFHHREIMRRLLKGERQCVVAREMGMSAVSVSRIVNDPIFLRVSLKVRQRTEQGLTDFHSEIDQAVALAMDYVKEILEDEKASPRLRFDVAKLVLDRIGAGERK